MFLRRVPRHDRGCASCPIGRGRRGGLGMEAIHTPEHCCFLLTSKVRGGPFALLSGESPSVGDLARPDLAIEAEDGARQLSRRAGVARAIQGADGGVEDWAAPHSGEPSR